MAQGNIKLLTPIRCAYVVKGPVFTLLHPGTTLNTCTQIIALSHNSCLSLTLHALMADSATCNPDQVPDELTILPCIFAVVAWFLQYMCIFA